jgi:hypothetical protein
VSALQTVHVRVNDAATGQPTPCRVRFTDADGNYHAPFGRPTEFPRSVGVEVGGSVWIGDEAHAYIDGACEIQLPPGRLHVAISKGPEYRPVETAVVLAPGKLALRFELERWTDLSSEGWYPGDVHCLYLTPHAALLEAAAEDVAVVNLLATEDRYPDNQTYRWFPNLLAFSGQRPALERPGHMVVVNSLNRHRVLGELILLNCHRLVFPLSFGGPHEFDNWTLADWCDQCHRKSGLVIGTFLQPPGEVLADLIRGKVDAVLVQGLDGPAGYGDAGPGRDPLLNQWRGLLDCGFRVPLAGGSRKASNGTRLGEVRTYARLAADQELTYHNWVEAVRAGRTFVTTGPLLLFSVNSCDPGAVIEVPADSPTVRVRAEARSLSGIERLGIWANGAVGAQAGPAQPGDPLVVDTEVTLPAGGWLTACCWAPGHDPRIEHPAEAGAAQTSPVYVHVAGKRPPVNPQTLSAFMEDLDTMLEWVTREGRFENEKQRQRLAGIFQSARAILEERARM